MGGQDIKQINWLTKQAGLSEVQREIFHEEMRVLKGSDGKVTVKDLLELAEEIKRSFPNK